MNRQARNLLWIWLALAGVVIATAIFCTDVLGQCQTPHPAVVEICNQTDDGRYLGSGTIVGPNQVLTCAHLFRGGRDRIGVAIPGGTGSSATILAIDHTWDLALLELAIATSAPPVIIADDFPKAGDPLRSCGWGPGQRCYQCNEGRATGYIRAKDQPTYETLEMSGSARDGDSGGPIFNERGEMVAVLWGTDGQTVGGTYCGRIRKFLQKIFGQWPPARGPPPQVGQPWNKGPGLIPGPTVPVQPPTPRPEAPPVQPVQPSPPAQSSDQFGPRLDAIDGVLGRLVDGLGNSDAPPTADAIGSSLANAVMPLALGALGLTSATPIGLGVWGAVGLLRARRRRRRGQQQGAVSQPEPVVVETQMPPPPQVFKRNRIFVSYEVPSRRLAALQMASDQYVRQFPGARTVVETIEAYADQYESGLPEGT